MRVKPAAAARLGLLALAVSVPAAACSNREPQARPSPSAGAASPSASAPPGGGVAPTLPADKAAQRTVVEAYFTGLDQVCAAWRAKVGPPLEMDPNPFPGATVGTEKAPGIWLVMDGQGTSLRVDTTGWTESKAPGLFPPGTGAPPDGAWIVTSTDGPTGLMPEPYSIACPENVFVGTIDH